MREEYTIQRQGKTHVLYPGLLNEVHTRFEHFAVKTDILEFGDRPVVKATFHGWYKDQDNPSPAVTTSGIGTAGRATDHKGPAVDAPLEMAETRAKARALRDAVNIGEAAAEELGEEEDTPTTWKSPSKVSNLPRKPSNAPTPTPTPPEESKPLGGEYDEAPSSITKSTMGRLDYQLEKYADLKEITKEEAQQMLEAHLERPISQLSEYDGHKWIGRYQSTIAKIEKEEENG